MLGTRVVTKSSGKVKKAFFTGGQCHICQLLSLAWLHHYLRTYSSLPQHDHANFRQKYCMLLTAEVPYLFLSRSYADKVGKYILITEILRNFQF